MSINTDKGEILLRQVGPLPAPRAATDVRFVQRLSNAKAVLGSIVLVGALIFAGVMWFKDKVLSINQGKEFRSVCACALMLTSLRLSRALTRTCRRSPAVAGTRPRASASWSFRSTDRNRRRSSLPKG